MDEGAKGMGSASAPREVPNQLFSRGCAHTAARRAAVRRAAVRRAAVDLLDAWLRHHSKST